MWPYVHMKVAFSHIYHSRNNLSLPSNRSYIYPSSCCITTRLATAILQTGRMSAFMVDRVNIFLTCSSVNMQNSVVVSDTVWARVRSPKILGDAGAAHFGWGHGWPLETHFYHICGTLSNLFAVRQAVCNVGKIMMQRPLNMVAKAKFTIHH